MNMFHIPYLTCFVYTSVASAFVLFIGTANIDDNNIEEEGIPIRRQSNERII